MDKFMLIYTISNGYHCSCCNKTWEERETFENTENGRKDAMDFILNIYKDGYEHSDREFIGITELFGLSDEQKEQFINEFDEKKVKIKRNSK